MGPLQGPRASLSHGGCERRRCGLGKEVKVCLEAKACWLGWYTSGVGAASSCSCLLLLLLLLLDRVEGSCCCLGKREEVVMAVL